MAPTDLSSMWQSPISTEPVIDGAKVALLDQSTHRRFGLKGKGTSAWLQDQNIPVPEQPNWGTKQDGVLIVRIAPCEILMLADLPGKNAAIDQLIDQLDKAVPAQCYPLPRQDMSACFRLQGSGAPGIMADYCAVDLRPKNFPDTHVAQTSVAAINAIVIRNDRDGQFGFDLVLDFASAAYLWIVLANRLRPNTSSL